MSVQAAPVKIVTWVPFRQCAFLLKSSTIVKVNHRPATVNIETWTTHVQVYQSGQHKQTPDMERDGRGAVPIGYELTMLGCGRV